MSISPKIKSINVQGKTYLDTSDIYLDIMHTLESLTSKPMNAPQMNVIIQKDPNLTDSENEMDICRKVLTKVILLSNYIASTGRTGPANNIIVGLDVYKYFLISNMMVSNKDGVVNGNLNGMNVIPSNFIKSNKVIVMRNVQKTENGLNVINCPNDMRYFLKETPNWNRIVNWFEVI